ADMAVSSGSSGYGNLGITLLGLPVSIPVVIPPNTVLIDDLGVLGVRVVLNEQVSDAHSIHVTAVHVTIDGGLLSLIGTLEGEIAVASAHAAITDCGDDDGDGIGNAEDVCPTVPDPHQADHDG